MTDQEPQSTSGRRYGLIAALLLTIILLASSILNIESTGYLIFILEVLVILSCTVLACREQRAAQNGFLTFGEGFKTGMQVALVAGLILAIILFVYYNFIDTTYFEEMRETRKNRMIESGLAKGAIKKNMEIVKLFTTPLANSLSTMVSVIIMGSIISLVSASVHKS